ncbi:cysteine desulfhydrase [Marinomonas ostreistagni]|uniref:cysteine desulfhydrase n=1 Tax=Marinomonas ostreistagni TaxID=359209 RepID=UPI00194EEB8F|nr:cysteine desulfhydrase [Marinomonas ostreistagni]MBM6550247.1 cysteine desulfhydrase [Marinomonas ostreistagni]
MATFGGPHSNHIAAFTAQCHARQLQPIIIVRGEVHASLTPTLRQAVDKGAILFPSERKDYRLGLSSAIRKCVDEQFGQVYWVPEGGGGELGFLGCLEWAESIFAKTMSGAHVCVAAGTGTTAAGFASSSFASVSVFSALKGVTDLEQQIVKLCDAYHKPAYGCLKAFDESLHGGFGKLSDNLLVFLAALKRLNPTLQLDPVYTAKMVYRVNELLAQGKWRAPHTLFIHTGGLQGWQGVSASKNPYSNMSSTAGKALIAEICFVGAWRISLLRGTF